MSVFSEKEKLRRFEAAQSIIKSEGLGALLLLGNGMVGSNAYGAFRYFTDDRVFYYIQAAMFFPDSAPAAVATSDISRLEFVNNSFITDCVSASDSAAGVIDLLKSRNVRGRVGTCLELLPTTWALRILDAVPDIEFVDVSDVIFAARNIHSDEEVKVLRECAALADAAYEAVCAFARPGVTEQQIAAEIEYAIQKRGGEYNFTLISSGRFQKENCGLSMLHNASMINRVIESGDSVAMEITPRYNGYWTQLVRTVSVGEPSGDLVRAHEVSVGSIKAALPALKPGNPISAIAEAVRSYVEGEGFIFGLPCGHICAVDLNEERLDDKNKRLLLPGMAVILHPSNLLPGVPTGIFWGETYLITDTGCERMMKTDDTLAVLK